MKATIVVTLILTGALCLAQDPIKVAPNQYKLIAENDDVRVIEVNLAPGAKTATHSHPAVMSVLLSPGVVKWTQPSGQSSQSPPDLKRGSVVTLPAETHVSENMGKTTLRAIVVEFKKPAPPAGKAHKAPVLANCKILADSAHATAQLCTGAAGSKVAKHTHGASVIYVPLTDMSAEMTGAAGGPRLLEMKRDVPVIAAPETHSGLNKGNAYELVTVDLK